MLKLANGIHTDGYIEEMISFRSVAHFTTCHACSCILRNGTEPDEKFRFLRYDFAEGLRGVTITLNNLFDLETPCLTLRKMSRSNGIVEVKGQSQTSLHTLCKLLAIFSMAIAMQ